MKKLSVVFLMSMICSNVSWADEVTVDMYAVATSPADGYAASALIVDKEGGALTEHAATAATTVTAVPQAPVAKPMPLKAPSLSREEVARLHLSLIREHVEAASTSSGFSFFSSGSKLVETLLDDINLTLSIHHNLPIA